VDRLVAAEERAKASPLAAFPGVIDRLQGLRT
jgi:hypothetical protein